MKSIAKKSNKYLLGIVVLLLLVVAFQSYLLFQNSIDTKSGRGIASFEKQDFFTPDTSIQDWDPFEDFQKMQKRMDSFFGNSLSGFDSAFPNMKSFSFGGSFSQNFDLKDQGNKYIITLDLPNLDQTKLDVSVEGQSLKISGNLERKDETRKDDAVSQSYRSQHFERYLTLPGPIKPETLIVDNGNTKLNISIEKSLS